MATSLEEEAGLRFSRETSVRNHNPKADQWNITIENQKIEFHKKPLQRVAFQGPEEHSKRYVVT